MLVIAFATLGDIKKCEKEGGLYFSAGFGQHCIFPPLKQ